MPVTTAGGIVGRVIAVGPNFAMVQVANRQARGRRRNAPGLAGDGSNSRVGQRSRRAQEHLNQRKSRGGESIVTTGLDRIYPKGF